MPMPAPFHGDSDAEDDYESGLLSPYLTGDKEPGDSSAEPTPTGLNASNHPSPGSLITSWSDEQVAAYIRELGLKQYCDLFLENGISGESLVALRHDELKEMGVTSVGHRLTILKGIFDVKIEQGVSLDPEDYKPPSAEASAMDQSATMSDILRIIQSIELRDRRIQAAEAELRKVTDEYRRLRDELLPVFRSHKNNSQPLPYHPTQPDLQPEVDSPSVPDAKSSILGRKFSTKRLLLGSASAPKNNSPTHILPVSEDIPEPSSAPLLSSTHSPRSANVPSPTSPSQYLRTLNPYSARGYSYADDPPPSSRRTARDILTAPAYSAQPSTPIDDVIPSSGSTREVPSGEIFKSFRVSYDDPCEKVLPAAMKKYGIQGDWKNYALYIVYGDQERCLGLREKPLTLFKQLVAENRKPMFMLRKHAAPMEGHSGPSRDSTAEYGGRGHSSSIQLPGGVL